MNKSYTVNIKLLSDMHINGGVSADSVRVTVRQDNKPYIPATLLKGMVRSNFEMLLNTCGEDTQKISEMFFGGEGFALSRAVFDNLVTKQKTVTDMRANTAINRFTRKTLDGALVYTETVSCFAADSGEPVIFSGGVTVRYTEEMLKYEKCFLESFRLITALGTGKSRGLGFAEVEIK